MLLQDSYIVRKLLQTATIVHRLAARFSGSLYRHNVNTVIFNVTYSRTIRLSLQVLRLFVECWWSLAWFHSVGLSYFGERRAIHLAGPDLEVARR